MSFIISRLLVNLKLLICLEAMEKLIREKNNTFVVSRLVPAFSYFS